MGGHLYHGSRKPTQTPLKNQLFCLNIQFPWKEPALCYKLVQNLVGFTDHAGYLGLALSALFSESSHPLTSNPHHPSFQFLNMSLAPSTVSHEIWMPPLHTHTNTHKLIQPMHEHAFISEHAQRHELNTLPYICTHHIYTHIQLLCWVAWIVPFSPAQKPCCALFYSRFSLILKTLSCPNVPLQLYSYVLLTFFITS